jgi:hypothetical protein
MPITQEQFQEIFAEHVGDMYEHSDLWMDYTQNVSLSSTKKEAVAFAKVLAEFLDEE